MTEIRAGIGGWVFPPWRGVLYPKGLPQAKELHHASRQVTSIEINGTFYGSQKPASFRRWRDDTPEDFVFSLKGPRFATHRRALGEAGDSVKRFFDSGVLELQEKLGPILWQFAPTTQFDQGNFASFLELLPRKLEGREIRHVLEVRHQSFLVPDFIALMRKYKTPVAFVDSEDHPAIADVTGDFVYARLRRMVMEEESGYSTRALGAWVKRFETWSKGGEPDDLKRIHPDAAPKRPRDCFVYFINGAKVRAPAAAQAFLKRLKG